ncbi:MAG: aldo/keto reductase [Theionarchaea archaeon DG-70]|nr:MAG: aldo/keto reductase [Theionarchaea archaeon DG-70]
MQYRTFDSLDWKPSALGFGAMRLPVINDDRGNIEEPEAIRMMRCAVDHGVNYIDTAYPYHEGTSEIVVGKALQDGYRQKVRLATKLPCWLIKTREDFDRYFNEQLERLHTDYIDFYLLHALREKTWSTMNELNVFDWAEQKISGGYIKYLGFSFHDTYEMFKKIVDGYDKWTFCQIQYNYMDEDYQAGTKGLKYAASKGLAVVIMEPIRGGQLAYPPQSIQELWDTAPKKRTPAAWALQWVWNHPEVSLVLSGMSTMEQVKENVATADVSGPNTLTADELALIAQVRDKYQELCPIPCTSCEYCVPCPNNVRIPFIFEIYNSAIMYNKPKTARSSYWRLKEEERADQCVQCGDCEEKCPQSIEIMKWLEKAHEFLSKEE